MRDLWLRLRPLLLLASTLARAAVFAVIHHWLLAIFCLVAAFAIWFFVEDVENPRIEATVPGEDQALIAVEVVNVPAGLIVSEPPPLRAVVEAREEDIDDLRASDFSAVVDASNVGADSTFSLPVTVTTQLGGVSVVRPEPRSVEVSVVAAVSRELPVTVVVTGEVTSGFRQGLPEVDPPFVTISGRAGLVESVDEVQATVSILGLQNTETFDVNLIARTSDGSRVTVTLSRNRARVTVPIEEALLTRQIAVLGGATGQPARGYSVTDVFISPSPVEVTGPREIVESLPPFVVEDVDVSGAIAQVIQSREIDLPAGVTAEVDTVFVSVSISAQEGWRALRVAPTFADVPPDLAVAPGLYAIEVQLAGPEPVLARLGIDDVTATISFADAVFGFARYEAEVSVPNGIEVVEVSPVLLQLVRASGEPGEETGGETDEEDAP